MRQRRSLEKMNLEQRKPRTEFPQGLKPGLARGNVGAQAPTPGALTGLDVGDEAQTS
jgi:hypothetical protein